MSKKEHTDARLDEYGGPFFTPLTATLRDAMDAQEGVGWCNLILGTVCETLENFVGYDLEAVTSDDYHWFSRLNFTGPDGVGSIALLIPWSQDWDKRNGTTADRAIALHTQQVSAEEADRLLAPLLTQVHRVKEILAEMDAAREAAVQAERQATT